MEQMKAFIAEIETDVEFNKEINSLLKDGKVTEIVQLAARKGFTITEDDLREQLAAKGTETGESTNGVLEEEALENVAGGHSSSGVHLGCNLKCVYSPNSQEIKVIEGIQYINCFSPLGINCLHCGCRGTNRCIDRWHIYGRGGASLK